MPSSANKLAAARQVEMIVRQLETLSTFPQVAGNALRLLTAEWPPENSEFVEMLKADPALSARILSTASQQIGPAAEQPLSIEQAVEVLGSEQIRDAVLSVRVFQAFEIPAAEQEEYDFRHQLALHALATACAADQLAQEALPAPLRSIAFSAGLLHDLGKLALLEVMPKSFLQMVRHAQSEGVSLIGIEQHHLGLDHTTIGKRLAEKWNLPRPIQTAVWLHHSDTEAMAAHIPFIEVASLVHLADCLARKAEIGVSGSYDTVEEALLTAARVRLSSDLLDRVFSELPERVQNLSRRLGLHTPAAARHYYGAIHQTAAELARLNLDLSQTSRQFQIKSRQVELLDQFLGRVKPQDTLESLAFHLAYVLSDAVQGAVCVLLQTDLGEPSVCCFTVDRQGKQYSALLQLPAGKTVAARQEKEEFSVRIIDAELDWFFDKFSARLNPAISYSAPLAVPGFRLGRVIFELAQADRLEMTAETIGPLCQAAASVLQTADVARRNLELSERLAEVLGNLKMARRQIAQMEAIHSVAEMAAGAAHELNNPLSVISGRAQLLASSETDPQRQQELRIIQERTEEMAQILKDLMSYARPAQPEKHIHSVLDLVNEAIRRTCKIHNLPQMAVRLEGLDSLADVYVDFEQIVEVLTHILLNSLQSYPGENGPIRISRTPLQPPSGAAFSISDQGCGMDPKTLANASKPFFSARPAGRRRGMGLARAQRLLQVNDGSMMITSRVGKGTTVTITLPGT
ncbi:MAG TPA: HDOD domain-containing protein [Anaerohalosphaeraceae bacterium]|nr:HDOD domain-containing protein [Anaerohalosphaeraceae bacterium]